MWRRMVVSDRGLLHPLQSGGEAIHRPPFGCQRAGERVLIASGIDRIVSDVRPVRRFEQLIVEARVVVEAVGDENEGPAGPFVDARVAQHPAHQVGLRFPNDRLLIQCFQRPRRRSRPAAHQLRALLVGDEEGGAAEFENLFLAAAADGEVVEQTAKVRGIARRSRYEMDARIVGDDFDVGRPHQQRRLLGEGPRGLADAGRGRQRLLDVDDDCPAPHFRPRGGGNRRSRRRPRRRRHRLLRIGIRDADNLLDDTVFAELEVGGRQVARHLAVRVANDCRNLDDVDFDALGVLRPCRHGKREDGEQEAQRPGKTHRWTPSARDHDKSARRRAPQGPHLRFMQASHREKGPHLRFSLCDDHKPRWQVVRLSGRLHSARNGVRTAQERRNLRGSWHGATFTRHTPAGSERRTPNPDR